ncbi:hypothetical protein MKW92_016799 [Papaver armeniacum]|nr:hypothetical protein MKW92_016799 [Papaver armeniacum]
MFTNNKRQQEWTGRNSSPGLQYLQLVSEFQNATDEDCVTEPNEKLVEFGVGGIYNACVDPENAALISQCDGIPLVVQCLSNPVNYALGALYYLCNPVNKEEILKPEVVEVIERYASAGAVSVSFSNLAKVFLEKYIPGQT